jgi:hypothetical protein
MRKVRHVLDALRKSSISDNLSVCNKITDLVTVVLLIERVHNLQGERFYCSDDARAYIIF